MKKVIVTLITLLFFSCDDPKPGITNVQSPDADKYEIERVRYGTYSNDYFLYVTRKDNPCGNISVTIPKTSGKTTSVETTIQEQNPSRIIEASAIVYEDSTIIILKK